MGAQSLPPFASRMPLGLCLLIPELSVPSSVKFGSNPGHTGLSWGFGGIHHPPTTATDLGSCAISAMTFPSRTPQPLSLYYSGPLSPQRSATLPSPRNLLEIQSQALLPSACNKAPT